MTAATAIDRKSIFSADLIRSKGGNLGKQLDVLAPFADALAERIGTEFSALGEMSAKVTVISTRTSNLSSVHQAEAGYDVVTAFGTVSCWRNADRQFDNLMCELCLGASGKERNDDDVERPATAFEKKIRDLVSEKIVVAIATSLGEIGDHPDLVVRPRGRVAARKTEVVLLCYSVRFLLNIFDAALEFEIFMSFAECVKLICGDRAIAPEAVPSASELVRNTHFSVEVYLKPDTVDVRQILDLAPGKILTLNVGASTPVELHMNGTKLYMGSLSFDNSGGRIKLLEGGAMSGLSKS